MSADSIKHSLWGDKWRAAVEQSFPVYSRSQARAADIKISGRTVEARIVDGSWSTQKTVLLLSRFSEEEESALMDSFKKNPQLAEALAHHLEPKEALELAEGSGIKLFPERGVKFSVKCSCGMRGMCHHAYAAIYGVGKKVDRDPFILFKIRGMNVGMLAEQCTQASWEEDLPVLEGADSLPLFAGKFTLVPKAGAEEISEVPEYESADIVDVRKAVVHLVSPNAVFHADFVDAYRECLLEMFAKNFERYPEKSVDLAVPGIVRYRGGSCWMFGNVPLEWALDAVSVEGSVGMEKADVSFRLLDYARRTALEILHRGTVFPKPFAIDKKDAQFFWQPMDFIPEVHGAIERLQAWLPAKFVRSDMEPPHLMTQNAAEMLVLAILNTYLRVGSEKIFRDERLYAFFGDVTLAYSGKNDGIEEFEKWLSGYNLPYAPYLPVINGVDAGFGKVDVDLDFLDKSTGEINSYSKLWIRDFPSEKRARILRSLQPLQNFLPGYDDYVSAKAMDNIHLSGENLIRFLNESVPLFRALDLEMDLPKGIERVVRGVPHPQIVRSDEKKQAGFCRLENLLQMNWSLEIAGKWMDGKKFLELYAESKDLLYYEGQYFYVLPEDVKTIKEGLRDRFKIPAIKVLQIALAGEFEGFSVDIAPEALEEIHKLKSENESDIPVPPQIRASLRPYQKRGFAWMLGNSKLGFGSIIADDMGLGKTLQVITLLQQMKNDGALENEKAIVIVPTGLLQNWKKELSKFAPELNVRIYHGSHRQLEMTDQDVLVTTYGVLRSDKDKLTEMRWQVAVIDEAQNIKNAGTSQSRVVRSVSAKIKIAMSGTPVENRLLEFWSIMDFCNRGFLGSAKSFHEEFEFPIQGRGNKHRAVLFKKISAPFLLRRLKTDKSIIADLPEKLEQNDWATLSPEQESLYRKTFDSCMAKLADFNVENAEEKFERSAAVLRLIVALKQICNHPVQYLKEGKPDPALSGKMQLFLDIVGGILETDEKVLVFTQFTEMGEILQEVLKKELKAESLFYHGGLSVSAREQIISEFETSPEKRILILSLKAGGTGLNLTVASQVIHYDLWWNPAVEAQATDRAYRIGQNRRVVVHRLITKDTFEEKINDMLESKKKISEMTVASGENWITKLSDDELRQVFTLGKN